MAKNASAVTLVQQMDVEIGVFDAATIAVKYQEKNDKFDIKTTVNTANLFNTLYPFQGLYESYGLFKKADILPQLYHTHTKTRNHVRDKKVLYDATGKAFKRISAKDKKINETPIDNVPQSADAADLQSVFAEVLYNLYKDGDCTLKREIYDGKKHYKVIVKKEKEEKRYFDFTQKEETATLCSTYIENLKDNNDNILWEVSADKPIKFYIGTDEKTKMPFVLEIRIDSTPLGALKVTPTTLEIK